MTRCKLCSWGYPITLLGMFTKVDAVTHKQSRVINVCPLCVKTEMQKVYDANPKMYRLPAVATKALADAERWRRNHPEHAPDEAIRELEPADHQPGDRVGSLPHLRDAPVDEHPSGDHEGGLGSSAVPHRAAGGVEPHHGS